MIDPRIHLLFNPNSVAVVGASSNFEKASGYPLRNLLRAKFTGTIYPINPHASEIGGIRCYASILDVPEVPDLAILMVDATLVLDVIEDCGKKGVKVAIVGAGGFSELGQAGQERQEALAEATRRYGIRVCGPNCHGIFNVMKNLPLGYNFSYGLPLLSGPIAIASQSGALLGSLTTRIFHAGQGLSYVVSTGNEVDLNLCDYLEFFIEDESTKVAALLIEGIPDGPRFLSLADQAYKIGKAIVVLKVGKSERGVLTTMAHTSRMAGSAEVYEAAFRQYGIISTDTVEAFLGAARMIANQPAPRRGKLMVLTSTGAGASLMADKAAEYGIDLADISDDIRARIPPRRSAILANPFDTAGMSRRPGFLTTSCDAFASDPANDCLLLFLGPLAVRQDYAKNFCEAVTRHKKTAAGIMSLDEEEIEKIFRPHKIPLFDLSTDACFRVLSSVIQYGRFCEKHSGVAVEATVRSELLPVADKILQAHPSAEMLPDANVRQLLSYYGLSTPDHIVVKTFGEAVEAAARLCFPVILKGLVPDVTHKHDVGLVSGVLWRREELEASYALIIKNSGQWCSREPVDVLVEKYVDHDYEFILGVKYDSTFGPVVLFGLGGSLAEILNDYALRLAPLTFIDAEEMILDLKSYPLLKESSAKGVLDFETIKEVILKTSRLALDLEGKIAALDINPVVFDGRKGETMVLDAKVHLCHSQPELQAL